MFGGRTAVDKERSNPVVRDAVEHSAGIYGQTPLGDFIDERRQSQLARELFLEVNRICNTLDPVTVCREELATNMLQLAGWQVLVIPPEPKFDASGLRGQPGVSGELGKHLVALCEKDDELRSTMYDEAGSADIDWLWKIVQTHYWESYWRTGTLDGIRVALGDAVPNDDWFRPFLHAACVKREHDYRWLLELPPAFPEAIARDAATVYSMFTDIVLSGSRNPAAEWREYCSGTGVPMPGSSQ